MGSLYLKEHECCWLCGSPYFVAFWFGLFHAFIQCFSTHFLPIAGPYSSLRVLTLPDGSQTWVFILGIFSCPVHYSRFYCSRPFDFVYRTITIPACGSTFQTSTHQISFTRHQQTYNPHILRVLLLQLVWALPRSTSPLLKVIIIYFFSYKIFWKMF